jgi:hypothetical protein
MNGSPRTVIGIIRIVEAVHHQLSVQLTGRAVEAERVPAFRRAH